MERRTNCTRVVCSNCLDWQGILGSLAVIGFDDSTNQQLPGSRIYTTQHDTSGNPTTVTFNGGQRLMSYDGLGRVITQTEYRGATIISTLTDGYDAGGRKVSQTRDGVSTLYGYDNINRLTSQQVSGSVGTYAYDAIGNQTLKWQEGSSPVTMSYDAASRLTTMVQGTATNTFSYDNNGNTLEESLVGGLSQTIYTYDHRNRMATSNQLPNSSPGQYLQTYTYDGDGLRRTKMTNSNSTFTYDKDNNLVSVVSSPQTTTFIWDQADYLAEETGGSLTVQYSTMNVQLVEENRGGTVTEYVPDTLGSVIKTTNSSGTVTSSTTFWPYGETNSSTGTNPSNFGFVGTWGFYADGGDRSYVRARDLRVDLSKWLTVDPLWPSELPYIYANCVPTSEADSSGYGVITNKDCKAGCDRLYKKLGARQACYYICEHRNGAKRDCSALRRYCKHLCQGHGDGSEICKTCENLRDYICPPENGLRAPVVDPTIDWVCSPSQGPACYWSPNATRVVVGGAVLVGLCWCGWEIVKWGVAIGGAPETGGCSLGLLAIP